MAWRGTRRHAAMVERSAAGGHALHVRLRAWMALATLFPVMRPQDFSSRLPALWDALNAECVRAARQYGEWMIAAGIIKHGRLEDMNDLLERLCARTPVPQDIESVLAISGAVGAALGPEHTPFIEALTHRVASWVADGHARVRTCALFVFRRLWTRLCGFTPAPAVLSVDVLRGMAARVECCESTRRALDRLEDDETHAVLGPLFGADKLTVHIVFWVLPAVPSERISAYSFGNVDPRPGNLPLGAEETPCPSPVLSLPTAPQQSVYYTSFQQKVDPFAAGILDRDIAGEVARRKEADRHRDGFDYIVVASLLDSAANVGGLCRTCEVLGAASLVVNDKRILDDATFTSLAVTAQKWIDIDEVPRGRLVRWLQARRADGFRIVAIEQGTAAVSLANVHFGRGEKTVLVVGNEREGVPVEVLHVADDCIEVPQYGIVRSLNAHVAGSLVLWEARRQVMASAPEE